MLWMFLDEVGLRCRVMVVRSLDEGAHREVYSQYI